jgi:hypothetical protein
MSLASQFVNIGGHTSGHAGSGKPTIPPVLESVQVVWVSAQESDMELFELPLWPFLLLLAVVCLALFYRFTLHPGKVTALNAARGASTSTSGRTIIGEGWYGS